MRQTVEAVIDEKGNVRLLEPVHLNAKYKALVIILDDVRPAIPDEVTLLSEPSLSVDWNRPEEDTAWQHLQQGT